MKIIHVLNTSKYSGAENVAISIIEKMKENNEIIYVSLDGDIRKHLEEKNIKFEPVKKLNIKEIRRVIKKYKPDIIHAHDFTASVVCAFACGKIKLISHIHNNSTWLRAINVKSIVYLITSFKYSNIFLVSDSIIKEYIFGNCIKNKSEIIGNPVDVSTIINKANNDSTNMEEYDLVFLGRLSKEKNPTQFIEIVKLVQDKRGINAVMIGDGPLKEECKELIDKYQLNSVITLKGFLNNPYVILKNSKILCMTSIWEGFGLAAIEALTLGKPVIAPKVGGLPNIVDENCR